MIIKMVEILHISTNDWSPISQALIRPIRQSSSHYFEKSRQRKRIFPLKLWEYPLKIINFNIVVLWLCCHSETTVVPCSSRHRGIYIKRWISSTGASMLLPQPEGALLRYGAYSISKIAIISAGVTTIGVCGKCFLFPVTR